MGRELMIARTKICDGNSEARKTKKTIKTPTAMDASRQQHCYWIKVVEMN
jgi:hypothetical protein